MHHSTLKIAWRNLGRNRKRTGLALLAIAVGQFGLLATQGLMHGYADNIRLALTGPMLGHVQVHAPDWREERAMDLVINRIHEVLAVVREDQAVHNAGARIYAPVLVAPKREAYTAMVVGVQVDVESEPFGLLSGLKQPLQRGQVLLGFRLAERIGVQAGQEIAIVGQGADGSIANDLYTVQAVLGRSPVDLVNQSGIIMRLEDAQALLVMPDQAHEIVVRTTESGQALDLASRLSQALPKLEVKAWQDLAPELLMVIEMADVVGYFILVLVFIAAVTGIANTLMMSVFERMHEFGMLLALGTRPPRLVRLVLTEALCMGLLGTLIGTGLGYAFVAVTSVHGIDMATWGDEAVRDLAWQGLNLPLYIFPRLEGGDVLLGLIAILCTSLIAAIWPAWITARLEPMEAMRA